MFQLTVLYGQPQDPQAFDRYYEQTHAPLALKIPGIKGYTASRVVSLNPQESSPYYLIAALYFDSEEAMGAAFQSPEGLAAAGDVQNFATGGVTMLAGGAQVYDPVALG
ncbi:MAG TPA: EthD family reductase [Ktedonobacteraceae bacterium]|nr:EthD family reductase [Ktedonobacteraceae bacterium]